MTDLKFTKVEINPKIKKPAFQEKEVVVLKRDYTKIDEFCSKYLIKGAVCIIELCGCSKYVVEIEEGKVIMSPDTDCDELCFISVLTDGEDGDDQHQDYVRAKDLQLFRIYEIE